MYNVRSVSSKSCPPSAESHAAEAEQPEGKLLALLKSWSAIVPKVVGIRHSSKTDPERQQVGHRHHGDNS
jgi:hypothetical protein